MHVGVIRRVRRRQLDCAVRSAVTYMTLVVALLLTPQTVCAQAAADFEKPPVLNVTELIPEKLLDGADGAFCDGSGFCGATTPPLADGRNHSTCEEGV